MGSVQLGDALAVLNIDDPAIDAQHVDESPELVHHLPSPLPWLHVRITLE
jgi:hypothetical protein